MTNETRELRVMIVDDEPLARERLRDLLDRESRVSVVAECADGREAIQAVRAHAPDVLFLDVQMPEIDGFDVLKELKPAETPLVIFVTAYDRYALRAFDVHALDYLLKPFDRDRFRAALEHARAQLDDGAASFRERVLEMLSAREEPAKRFLNRLLVRSEGKVYFAPVDEIDWIEAAGNYVRLHVGSATHLLRDSLGSLEEKLDPLKFARVHRSAIVQLDRIEHLEPLFHGDYTIALKSGQRLTLSRYYRAAVEQRLGGVL